jgi:hypothetical protein
VVAFAHALGIGSDAVRDVTVGNRPAASLAFAHPRIDALFCNVLGFVPGPKTGIVTMPEALISSRHAWRGVIDGDGYANLLPGRGPQMALHLGLRNRSVALQDQFSAFAERVTGVTTYRYENKGVVTGETAALLIDVLYEGSSVWTIARKRTKALALAAAYRERRELGFAEAPPTPRQLGLLTQVADRGPVAAIDLPSQGHRPGTKAHAAALRNSLAALERRGLVAPSGRKGHGRRRYQVTAAGARVAAAARK